MLKVLSGDRAAVSRAERQIVEARHDPKASIARLVAGLASDLVGRFS